MIYDDFNEKINRFAHGIIRRKIKQLIGRAGFTKEDRKDLEQELILRLLKSLSSFNPDQAHRNVFTTTVIERYVANILRDKQAEKRDHRRIGSLNVPIDMGDDDVGELADLISQIEYDARRGRQPRSDEDLAQLVQDMAEVLAHLPDDLRELAERLKTQKVAEIARENGIPRTTLNGSVIAPSRDTSSASKTSSTATTACSAAIGGCRASINSSSRAMA
jgi:RNA polymerase sigma-70 factor, ECF subfamily